MLYANDSDALLQNLVFIYLEIIIDSNIQHGNTKWKQTVLL